MRWGSERSTALRLGLLLAFWSSLNLFFTRQNVGVLDHEEVESSQQTHTNPTSRNTRPHTIWAERFDYKNLTTQTNSFGGQEFKKQNLSVNRTEVNRTKHYVLNSCIWSPFAPSPCSDMLRKRVKLPLTRLLFFGDSTIHNLVSNYVLETKLVDFAMEHCAYSSCIVRTTERCDLSYGLPGQVPTNLYVKPDLTLGEGPAAHGYNNPGCSDCGGCSSRFLDCGASEKRCLVPHGGFVHMEFARDVVWQTFKYNTTQENTADLLHDGFLAYPNTACVMAAGLHDMDVPFNNVTKYINNVNWYLSMYIGRVCQHVVWLANASPASDNYTQTIARTKDWNEAVQQELRANFLDSTTFIDLWSASQTETHADNLHMDISWNVHLTNLFLELWSQS